MQGTSPRLYSPQDQRDTLALSIGLAAAQGKAPIAAKAIQQAIASGQANGPALAAAASQVIHSLEPSRSCIIACLGCDSVS